VGKGCSKILKDQGIIINQGDVLKGPDALYAFSKIEIIRGFDITLRNGNQTLQVKCVKSSIADILKQNGVSYDDDDILSHKPDDIISEPTLVSVDHIEKKVVKEVVSIPSKTNYIRSSDIFIGRHVELTAGVNGQKNVESEVVYKNNQEVSRTVLSEEIISQPVDHVVKVGTKGSTLTSRGESLRFSRVIDVKAYAYSSGYITAIGTKPRVGVVAVDPKVIPLGSRLYIESIDGESWAYGYAVAEDTGGMIKGNTVDLYMQTKDLCKQFGIRQARVYILE
jgi:3D (Asp-Asp-Asp) domain-containing protein